MTYEAYAAARKVKSRPRLGTVVRLAELARCSMMDLFDPDAFLLQRSFSFVRSSDERLRRVRPTPEKRRLLKNYLRLEVYAPAAHSARSLLSLCRVCGVSVGFAHYAFPSLTSELASRRRKEERAIAEKKKSEARRAVENWFAGTVSDQRESKSRKDVVKELMRSTGLPKRFIELEVRRRIGGALPEINEGCAKCC
jgi:hypothetical protein